MNLSNSDGDIQTSRFGRLLWLVWLKGIARNFTPSREPGRCRFASHPSTPRKSVRLTTCPVHSLWDARSFDAATMACKDRAPAVRMSTGR